MTGIEPGDVSAESGGDSMLPGSEGRDGGGNPGPFRREIQRRAVAPHRSSPIIWKWWLLAGLLSLTLWAAIFALVF